ncbi:MAG: PqqD family protein [Ilumatobacteraceae bacterium]
MTAADSFQDASTAGPTVTAVLQHGAVRWALAGNEVVVHVPALAATHVLDPTAAMLWQCLDGVSPMDEIFADMAEAFGVAPEVVEGDCLPVVRSWFQAGIAVVPGSTVPADERAVGGGNSGRVWRRLVDPPST